MDIRKYSKKTWIAVLVLALFSVTLDVLFLTKMLGSDSSSQSMNILTLIISLLGVYYSIRGIGYHVKKEKDEQK